MIESIVRFLRETNSIPDRPISFAIWGAAGFLVGVIIRMMLS